MFHLPRDNNAAHPEKMNTSVSCQLVGAQRSYAKTLNYLPRRSKALCSSRNCQVSWSCTLCQPNAGGCMIRVSARCNYLVHSRITLGHGITELEPFEVPVFKVLAQSVILVSVDVSRQRQP